MNAQNLIKIIDSMKSDRVRNYVIAGLDSHLLKNGCVRYFENQRQHQDHITPHSHRFDFACLVLQGTVWNTLWRESTEADGDFFEESTLTYTGDIGVHETKATGRSFYATSKKEYQQGNVYSMKANEIHSIQFSRGAKVLFFEGPQISETSMIIEPVVNGEKIPTYAKRDYMFQTQ